MALKNEIATHHYTSNSVNSPTGELCHTYMDLGFCWDQCCLGHPDRFRGSRAISIRIILIRERVIWKEKNKIVVYHQKVEKSAKK